MPAREKAMGDRVATYMFYVRKPQLPDVPFLFHRRYSPNLSSLTTTTMKKTFVNNQALLSESGQEKVYAPQGTPSRRQDR